MKIVAAADTHGLHGSMQVPEGDVFIHAGDFSCVNTLEEVELFAAWLADLPHKYKIVIAGNHELFLESGSAGLAVAALQKASILYLEDTAVCIDGVKFFGSPWTPAFQNWAFMLPRGEVLRKKWQEIPEGTDVLVTHGPPAGIFDHAHNLDLGCRELLAAVKRVRPRLHIFGHIHEQYGVQSRWGITFANASICDHANRINRDPLVIEYPA